ncbi:MAG TPA: DNA polymerase I [Rickettsiales bacterium]|nr:DNA polymerase I [Rickettsiales bacterium]
MTKKLALIDGYGFVFRAFHSLPPLTRQDKTPVGAVYGFTNMLIKLLASLDVTHLAVVFDSGSKTFRNDIYPEYKANRPPCPEDLIPQFPLVREAAESLNLITLEKIGVEADDIIATLAKDYAKKDFEVLIVSSDKDLMQLIGGNITMYDAMKNKIISEKEVEEKFFVKPNQVLDVLSIIGDSSDNVPGIKGIGPKGAAELVLEFGSLENIFQNLDKIKQSKRKEYLENSEEKAKLSKVLITLKDDVEIGVSEEDLKVKEIDPHKLIKFLLQQGFRSLVERVKKEFEIKDEIIKEEISTTLQNQQMQEIKSANFDEIKRIKISDEKKFVDLLNKIHENSLAIIDFENSFQDLTSIAISTTREDKVLQEIFYFELKNQKNENIDLFNQKEEKSFDEEIFVKEIIKILQDNSVKKIFFDAKSFFRRILFLSEDSLQNFCAYEDISLINHLLNSSIRNDLRQLANMNLSDNFESRNFGKFFAELEKSKIPQDLSDEKKQEFYCFRNYVSFQLYKILSPKIFEQKLTNSYQNYEKPLLTIIAKMEREGVKVDIKKLQELSKEFEGKIAQLTKEIYKITGEEFNIASTQQLSKILFEKMGLASSKKSKKTGVLSTKSSVLEELSLEGHEIADKILDFRKFSKLQNTYTDALPQEINEKTGRIHSSFSTINTITGRFSSNNPNLQNIPIKTRDGRKIRECFIASKDNFFISADYSQIELRVIAHIAQIDNLIEAFHQDKDIHKITAAQVFSLDEKDVTPEIRSKAKAINFGIIYGISAFGLARQLKIPRTEAKDYIDSYLKTYPGIDIYMKKYIDFARKNGYVETIGGRKCFIQSINDKNPMLRAEAERLAINAPIQGSAADIIKKAMIKLDKKLDNFKAKLILQVHDELIIEAPKDEVEKISQIIKYEMENSMKLDVTLKVDIEIAENWK